MDTKLMRARARENLRDNWSLSVGVALLAAMLGALLTSSNVDLNLELDQYVELHPMIVSVLMAWASVASSLNLVQLILGGTVQLGYTRFLLDQHDGKELNSKILFSQFDRFSQGFLQHFLRSLFTALWMLLFIIPGIMRSYSYAMTPFIMAENPDMKAKDAIRASMDMMEGHKADLFFLDLSFIGWAILNVFTLGIGSLWLNPYMNAAYAAFYRQLQVQQRYTTVEF